MKTLLTTTALLAGLSLAAYAQNNADSTGRNKPLLNNETKQEIREKVEQTEDKVNEEVDRSISYQQRNQLSWFQPNNLFAGGGLGFGVADGQVFSGINTRAGYFFQPGFAAGIRYDNETLIGNQYRARQFGVFTRYYPFRTRISSFIGVSLNRGREFSNDVTNRKLDRFTSVGLEIGVMTWVLRRLGAELSYEGNYYNRINPTASQSRGGRLKIGVNYFFGQVGGKR
ncbi:hypothetical protein [Spirosoma montaniterrae]|uniref:Outer membrane protein beta-barrel domain-containing protein n=1 Tax=Spirosoma montaniterrae TaxID=1178516 RepID=A0A1P9WYI8_9BACT|nr:hypothetical protein [Spirosoma montaniterrae]AQG80441.1 hypothetical protein AWR27_14580 [Spirosoma montaniterrae]